MVELKHISDISEGISAALLIFVALSPQPRPLNEGDGVTKMTWRRGRGETRNLSLETLMLKLIIFLI